MLHNKYFEILKEFTGDLNRKVHGRGIVEKVNMSQKSIALTLDELEDKGILMSKKEGSLRFFSLNIKNPRIKDILAITETWKKIEFLDRHKNIEHILKDDSRIVGIFGSFAKRTQNERSDIDLFVIGKKRPEDYDRLGKVFNLNISIRYYDEKEFISLSKEKNSLISEIMKNHVILFGAEIFTRISWRNFYGFN